MNAVADAPNEASALEPREQPGDGALVVPELRRQLTDADLRPRIVERPKYGQRSIGRLHVAHIATEKLVAQQPLLPAASSARVERDDERS